MTARKAPRTPSGPPVPYLGDETWTLVGFVDGAPAYQATAGGPVLPRRLATEAAADRGYRARFQNPPPPAPPVWEGVPWGAVGEGLWWGIVFGLTSVAWGGC